MDCETVSLVGSIHFKFLSANSVSRRESVPHCRLVPFSFFFFLRQICGSKGKRGDGDLAGAAAEPREGRGERDQL